jgi:hypothetical protein
MSKHNNFNRTKTSFFYHFEYYSFHMFQHWLLHLLTRLSFSYDDLRYQILSIVNVFPCNLRSNYNIKLEMYFIVINTIRVFYLCLYFFLVLFPVVVIPIFWIIIIITGCTFEDILSFFMLFTLKRW